MTRRSKLLLLIVATLLSGSFLVFKYRDINPTTGVVVPAPSPTPSSIESDPRYTALIQSLPQFSDYPASVSHIPPKPKLDHQSHLIAMTFWSVTEGRVDSAQQYDMGGHYLMDRHGTGNPDVIIIDGTTGQVFHEYGGIGFESVVSSSLVIFDPFVVGDERNRTCFSPSGNYDQCYGANGGNPRYAVWTGENFKTICEPIVRNWEVISCEGGNQ